MLGDVASHGFSAALVMALVMSAAGIHAAASITPDETLTALLDSLSTELSDDRDVLQRVLRRARSAHRPAVVRQRRPSLRVPRAALRRSRAARGHRATARARHGGKHSAAAGAVVDRITICWCSGPTGWWTRGTRRASRSASSGCWTRCCARRTESPEAIVQAVLAEADGVRLAAHRRPHAAGPADLAVPHAKRRLGQHFLTDPRILGRIADALGAGAGRHGARDRPGPGRAHRRARRAGGPAGGHREGSRSRAGAAPARSPRPRSSRATRSSSTGTRSPGPGFLVAGNIPYNITSPLIDKALEPPRPGADRVPGAEGSGRAGRRRRAGEPEYGALSVGVQAVARPERLFTVPAGAFHPRPKVDSAVAAAGAAGASRWSIRRSSAELSAAGGRAVRLPAEADGARAARADRLGRRNGSGESLARDGRPCRRRGRRCWSPADIRRAAARAR